MFINFDPRKLRVLPVNRMMHRFLTQRNCCPSITSSTTASKNDHRENESYEDHVAVAVFDHAKLFVHLVNIVHAKPASQEQRVGETSGLDGKAVAQGADWVHSAVKQRQNSRVGARDKATLAKQKARFVIQVCDLPEA